MTDVKIGSKQRDCYDSAYLEFLFGFFAAEPEWRLVHGYPSLTAEDEGCPIGTVFGHAWIERELYKGQVVVYDVGRDQFHRGDFYYEAGKIDPKQVRRFTHKEALQQSAKTKHRGPWGDVPSNASFYNK